MFTVNHIKPLLEPYTSGPENKLASYIAGMKDLDNRYLEGIKKFFAQHNSNSSQIIATHPRALIKEIDALFSEERLIEPISCNELNNRETLLQSLLNSINQVSKNGPVKLAVNIAIRFLKRSLVINDTKIQSIKDITSSLEGYLEKMKEIRKKSRPQEENPLIPNTLNSAPIAESNENNENNENNGSRPQSIQGISASTAHNNQLLLLFSFFSFFSSYLYPLLNFSSLFSDVSGDEDKKQSSIASIEAYDASIRAPACPDNPNIVSPRVHSGTLFSNNTDPSSVEQVNMLRKAYPALPIKVKTLLYQFKCTDECMNTSILELKSKIEKISQDITTPPPACCKFYGSIDSHRAQSDANKAHASKRIKTTAQSIENVLTELDELRISSMIYGSIDSHRAQSDANKAHASQRIKTTAQSIENVLTELDELRIPSMIYGT